MVATMLVFMLDVMWRALWIAAAVVGVLVLGGPQVRGFLTFRCLRHRKDKKAEPVENGRLGETSHAQDLV